MTSPLVLPAVHNLQTPSQSDTPASVQTDTPASADTEAFPEGLIYPPPEIKLIVDKTAAYVAQQQDPAPFEQRIRAREGKNAKFGFLNPLDAYHPYYRHRIAAVQSGALSQADTPVKDSSKSDEVPDDGRPKTDRPEPFHYLVAFERPITASDLDIIRLTALFVARSGPDFARQLSRREESNPQFDFLRPSHSLFKHYNRLVEQYRRVLNPEKPDIEKLRDWSGISASPIVTAESKAAGRRTILNTVRNRVAWEKWEREKRQAESDEAERERAEFESIDWHDFQVVSTITFTEQDDVLDLPPPMSLSEVESMTIAQKKMAAMIMEGNGGNEEDKAGPIGQHTPDEDAAMDVESDDEQAKAAPSHDKEKKIHVIKGDTGGQIKIRKDYIPKSKQKAKVQTTTCRMCNQEIPVDEIEEHVRIELLDPKWKEKQRQAEQNRHAATQLAHGVDVTSSLRSLARHRGDIFGITEDEERIRAEEQERAERRAREVIAWDGHLASAETTTDRFQSGTRLDEQIEKLHKARGLIFDENGDPQVGPLAPQPAAQGSASPAPGSRSKPASLPPAPGPEVIAAQYGNYAGATISAAPQPQAQPEVPNIYGYPPQPTAIYGMPPPAVAPPTVVSTTETPIVHAEPGTMNGSQALGAHGIVRPASDSAEGQPNAKKFKSDTPQYTESQWNELYPDPVTVVVKLPEDPSKPEWKLDGSDMNLEDIPLTYMVGTLRDRVHINLGIPVGRQRFKCNGKLLKNSTTLAELNFSSNEVLELTLTAKK